jgi:hypothetical protein
MIIRRIGIRILLLVGILLAAQWIYSNWFWEDDLWEYGQMLTDLQTMQDTAEVLYFGESSNFSYHPTRDSLQDRISDFISYEFPELRFGTINHAAYHAGLYRALIERIDTQSAVETVIVTLNLRTLGQAVTHSPLESSMQQEKVLFSGPPGIAEAGLPDLELLR